MTLDCTICDAIRPPSIGVLSENFVFRGLTHLLPPIYGPGRGLDLLPLRPPIARGESASFSPDEHKTPSRHAGAAASPTACCNCAVAGTGAAVGAEVLLEIRGSTRGRGVKSRLQRLIGGRLFYLYIEVWPGRVVHLFLSRPPPPPHKGLRGRSGFIRKNCLSGRRFLAVGISY
jgi:hypothetical protein